MTSIDTNWKIKKVYSDPARYKDSVRFGMVTSKRIAEVANRALEESWKEDLERHKANTPILDGNRIKQKKIVDLMADIGMPKNYRKPKKSRSIYTKYETVEAGYISDMKREFPISDGFELAECRYNELKNTFDAYAAQAEVDAEQDAKLREQVQKNELDRQFKEQQKAQLIVRYGLDETRLWDWDDILNELRTKDQRLDLAVAMLLTRGDWSQGYYRVSDAMKRFTIRDDTDKEIITDIVSCFDGDDCDGRVFRDTTWNYDRLFSEAADKQLSEDIQLAISNGDGE